MAQIFRSKMFSYIKISDLKFQAKIFTYMEREGVDLPVKTQIDRKSDCRWRNVAAHESEGVESYVIVV